MKQVLVIGSGRVAAPLIHYLLEQSEISVCVAGLEVDRSRELVDGYPQGKAVFLDLADGPEMSNLVRGADVVVSLVPAPFHPLVARHCITAKRSMVTTSYVSDKMHGLDEEARRAGILLLNEIGFDPGIDHMSAMGLIHAARARGGRVVEYRSYCGGIPSPEANDNPFGYKFSWSPAGVITASKSKAVFCMDGETIDLHGDELHKSTWNVEVDRVGTMEAYPNRDSLQYIPVYGLQGARTVVRATLRYPGWCDTVHVLGNLGFFDETVMKMETLTYGRLIDRLIGCDDSDRRARVAEELGLDPNGEMMARFDWLDLFGDEPVGLENASPLEALLALMVRRMKYQPGESDMLILRDEIVAEFDDGHRERSVSQLLQYGDPDGESAMARAVSLPAAVATRMILEGKIVEHGVRIPIEPEIYEPVLAELAGLGIHLEESVERLD